MPARLCCMQTETGERPAADPIACLSTLPALCQGLCTSLLARAAMHAQACQWKCLRHLATLPASELQHNYIPHTVRNLHRPLHKMSSNPGHCGLAVPHPVLCLCSGCTTCTAVSCRSSSSSDKPGSSAELDMLLEGTLQRYAQTEAALQSRIQQQQADLQALHRGLEGRCRQQQEQQSCLQQAQVCQCRDRHALVSELGRLTSNTAKLPDPAVQA